MLPTESEMSIEMSVISEVDSRLEEDGDDAGKSASSLPKGDAGDRSSECCSKTCPCLCGKQGLCGFGECCGHKLSRFEPVWLWKILFVIGEVSWALSLQPDYKDPKFVQFVQDDKYIFTDQVVRPMAWVAFTSMFMHIMLQFSNRMCLGNQTLVTGLSLWIDLFFDDLVQITAVSLHYTYGAADDMGDKGAALIGFTFGIYFALHNAFSLITTRSRCFGKGFTKAGYKGADHVEEAWCPYCILPGISNLCTWCIGKPGEPSCCSKMLSCCPLSCVEPLEDGTKECNCFCCGWSPTAFTLEGADGASGGRIACFLMFNGWAMALLVFNNVTAAVWYWDNQDKPVYQDNGALKFAIVSMSFGFPTLILAYVCEFLRARWIAVYGVQGKLKEGIDKKHFYRLNHVLCLILTIYLGGSICPWIVVLIKIINEAGGPETFSVANCFSVGMMIFMAFWEIITRELGVCEEYNKWSEERVRKRHINKRRAERKGKMRKNVESHKGESSEEWTADEAEEVVSDASWTQEQLWGY